MPASLVQVTTNYAPAATIAWSTVPGLDVSVVAGTTYIFRYTLMWFAAASTTGLNLAVLGPASPTYLRYSWILSNGATTFPAYGGSDVYDHANRAGANATSTSALAPTISEVTGAIVPSAAGTLSCRVLPDAAGTLTILRGSYGTVAS